MEFEDDEDDEEDLDDFFDDLLDNEDEDGYRLPHRIAFPKKKHMVHFIPALERYPVLLPASWIKRWRLGLQNRWKMKAAFKGIDQSESLEEAKMQYRLLKKIGL